MIELQKNKILAITPPGAIVDDAAFTTAAIDAQGWDYAVIYVLFGAMDIAMAALKLQESEASGSGFADVTGGDFSVSGTLPSATADNTFVAIFVDLRARKRYLDLVATGGDGTAGTYLTAFVLLGRGAIDPVSAADRGLAQQLFV